MKKTHSHKPDFFEKGYLGDAILGASDGIVTTFAIVAGVVGASLSSSVVLILGFAKLFADAFSMGAANYLGSKSERNIYGYRKKSELESIDKNPKMEERELRRIYSKKGFKGRILDSVIKVVTARKELWADVVMKEDLGLIDFETQPGKKAGVTFGAFIIAGLIPLLAYLGALFIPYFANHTFIIAIVITGFTLFLVGALRSKITKGNWFKEGLQMLVVAGVASVAAYYIGEFLSLLV